MKARMILSLVAVVCATGTLFAEGNVLQYRGQGWENTWTRWMFSDPEAWLAATNDESPYTFPGTGGTIEERNPDLLVPGEGDLLYMSSWNKLNLGGEEHTIAIVSSKFKSDGGFDATTGGTLYLKNGTLNITDGIGPRYGLEVDDGATLRMMKGSEMHVSWGYGAKLPINVKSNGRLEILGAFESQYSAIDVAEGGVLYFAPTRWRPHAGVGYASTVNVAGTLDAPNGFMWTTGAGTSGSGSVNVDVSGKIILGGDFSRNKISSWFGFNVNFLDGSSIQAASNTVKFTDLTSAVFKQDAAVTLQVDEEATLDVSEMTAESGVALQKTGAGALKIGGLSPSSLSVAAGTLVLDGSVPSGLSVASDATLEVCSDGLSLPDALAAGSALALKAAETRIDALTAVDDVAISADWSVISVGSVVVRSTDENVLAIVKGQLTPTLPAGCKLSISGEAMRLVEGSPYEFDASRCDDLGDLSGWDGLTQIPVGQDVTVKGAGVVRFTSSTPAFASIGLQEGATLQVEGGTETSPVVLPAIRMNYVAALRMAENAEVVLTNGLTCAGNAQELPVFEVGTNAVVFMTAPDWPMSPLKFKNVDIRLYGQIKMPMATGGGSGNIIYFGTADAGETTYFAMTAAGGSVYDPDDNTKGYVLGGGNTQLKFVCPASGGTVVPVRDIVLRDFRKWPESIYDADGFDVGQNNPTTQSFNFICEGETILVPAMTTRIMGGAKLLFRDSACADKRPIFNNNVLWGGSFVRDAAQLVFDGAQTYWQQPNTTYEPNSRGDGVQFLPDADGSTVVTLRGGAHLDIWRSFGNAKGVAEIENGSWDVGQRAALSSWNNSKPVETWPEYVSTNLPVFNGFKSVNIAEGGTFSVRATDTHESSTWRGWPEELRKWDRVTSVGAPLTGAGGLLVTNTLTDAHTLTVFVTHGDNTATGEAAAADTPQGRSYLKFADGANWAGTVVANGFVSLGSEQGDSPVTATFGSVRFDGVFPIRVWKTAGGVVNDKVNILSASTGVGGFAVDPRECEKSDCDGIVIGTYPANVELPPVARGWVLSTVPVAGDPSRVLLKMNRKGVLLIVR